VAVNATMERFGVYDFGLSAREEARAARLHAESVIVDMLFQGPCGYRSFTADMERQLEAEWEVHGNPAVAVESAKQLPVRLALRGEFPEYKECWDASGITAGERAVELGPNAIAASFGFATEQFDRFPWLVKALRASDFRRAKATGSHAAFLNTQSMTDIARDLDILTRAHGMGLRMMQLTYNWMNFIGAGCTERTDAGISRFGTKVIERLNSLGIIVDTSHCGRQTTLDACALSTAPVLASHTAAQGVYPHDRGKSDEEIRAIAATGGIVGVVAVPFFLAAGAGVTLHAMLDHIDYLTRLVGGQHVGIGTDRPHQGPKRLRETVFLQFAYAIGMRPEHGVDPIATLIGFDDYRDFPNITRGLVSRGYSDEQIKGILGENFLRVFAQVCG